MQILRLVMGHTKIAFSEVVLTQHLVVLRQLSGPTLFYVAPEYHIR